MKDNSVHFIDYQGGMKGAPQYDVASLLWQARAALPDEWKRNLLQDYMKALEPLLDRPLNTLSFISQYNGYVLIDKAAAGIGCLRVQGLFERKAHFLTSIPLALKNLKSFCKRIQWVSLCLSLKRYCSYVLMKALFNSLHLFRLQKIRPWWLKYVASLLNRDYLLRTMKTAAVLFF
ncbi:hypothetical protein KRR40_19890 [Niabella defluvii]|nr:hypothetical protein KRR40_19890 [Niabella sp. I65]